MAYIGQVYLRQQITRKYAELELVRKCSSRKLYDTFLADSIIKLEWFISLFISLGVRNLSILLFINVDEIGDYLKGLSSKSGRVQSSCRVSHLDHYCCVEPNVNLIMRVEASNPRFPKGFNGNIQRICC